MAGGRVFESHVQGAVSDLPFADGVGGRWRPDVPRPGKYLRIGEAGGREDIFASLYVAHAHVGQADLPGKLPEPKVKGALLPDLDARAEIKTVLRPFGAKREIATVHGTPEKTRGDRLAVDMNLRSAGSREHTNREWLPAATARQSEQSIASNRSLFVIIRCARGRSKASRFQGEIAWHGGIWLRCASSLSSTCRPARSFWGRPSAIPHGLCVEQIARNVTGVAGELTSVRYSIHDRQALRLAVSKRRIGS